MHFNHVHPQFFPTNSARSTLTSLLFWVFLLKIISNPRILISEVLGVESPSGFQLTYQKPYP